MVPDFRPREGGVSVVFDVALDVVAPVGASMASAGFVVRKYYNGDRPVRGGAPTGHERLAIDAQLVEFSDEAKIRATNELVLAVRQIPFATKIVSEESWTAGGGPNAGVREPRRPYPLVLAGAADLG